MRTLEMFLEGPPPRTTAQTREVAIHGGRPTFYKPAKLKVAELELTVKLLQHRPDAPMDGPLRLTVRWLFPRKSRPKDGVLWKTTRPDTDNLQKLLKDCMTVVGFWNDDSQVCSEIVEKFTKPGEGGIYVRIEKLDGGEAEAYGNQ